MRATARALNEVTKPENAEEAVDIAMRLSGAAEERRESVKLQWQETIPRLQTKNTAGKPYGWMSEADWQEASDILLEDRNDRQAVPGRQTSTATPSCRRTDDDRAMNREVIGIDDVSLVYRAKNSAVHALDRVSIGAAEGEFVALVGPSGCGKSTLLKLVSGLIPPSGGVIRVNRQPVRGPTASIGIVFQNPLLMAWRSTLRNILLQIEIRGLPSRELSRDGARADRAGRTGGLRGRIPASAVRRHATAGRPLPRADP